MRSIIVAVMALALAACSDDMSTPATSFTADLSSSKEIPPVVSSATGKATCTIASPNVSCTVTYAGLSAAPIGAHIHSGSASTAVTPASIRVNLCSGGTAPACPATVSGTITSGAQPVTGIVFDSLVALMQQYGAYVDVHTTPGNPNMEIRGQLFGPPPL